MNGTEWAVHEIQAVARAEAFHTPPLEFGQYVAWVEHFQGCVESLSPKHMAGTDSVTLCGRVMPPKHHRLPVAYKTLKLCGECAVKYARLRGGLSA